MIGKERQLEIPGSEGTPAQQALAMIRRQAEDTANALFGPTPRQLDANWYESLKQRVAKELISAFEAGMIAGTELANVKGKEGKE